MFSNVRGDEAGISVATPEVIAASTGHVEG